jgi:hypothetical protein
MSFYPSKEGNNLILHKDKNSKILIKLKDNSELAFTPGKDLVFLNKSSKFIYAQGAEYNSKLNKDSYFKGIIDSDEIDSSKVTERNNHIFWMNNGNRLTIKNDNINYLTDSTNFWVVKNLEEWKFRKMCDSEIQEIQTQRINWIKTSLFVLVIGGILVLGAAGGSISGLGGSNSMGY